VQNGFYKDCLATQICNCDQSQIRGKKDIVRIGYVSPTNPFTDRTAWSGTYYTFCKLFQAEGDSVEWVSYKNGGIFDKISGKVFRLLFGGLYDHSQLAGHVHVSSIKQDLTKFDVLFIPGQVDIAAELRTTTPIIYYTDGTVPLMVGYYWFGLSSHVINDAKLLEKKAMTNASFLWFSSQWAAQSAIKDLMANPVKVSVFPFVSGINNDQAIHASKYDGKTLRLLFSGVDWERKGGQIAVDTARILNKRGIATELTICGVRNLSKHVSSLPFVHNLGFLNKNDPKDRQCYLHAWQESNIFILPTRAECAGIVFCEAASFGMPVITTETGGTSSYVVSGENGERLPLSATASDYADVIGKWLVGGKLGALSTKAAHLYAEQYSWHAWEQHFQQQTKEIEE
jgi:glycosyltransferase involved in cell wall biosynthesis